VTVRESGATNMSPAACTSSTSMQLSVSKRKQLEVELRDECVGQSSRFATAL
jgi:hypothetical protein